MSDPTIVPPLFWEWFNIWLNQFLKDLYHEIKMLGLRGGSNTNSPYSHTCANHGMPSQPTGIDMTLSIPTSLTLPSPAPHLNPGPISFQSLSTVSLQFMPAGQLPPANHGPHNPHNHLSASRNHSQSQNLSLGHVSHGLNHGHSHTSSLGLGIHNHTNNQGINSSHNPTNTGRLGSSHSHTNSLGLNASHSFPKSVGVSVNLSNGQGVAANNSSGLCVGTSQNQSSNLSLGGSHSHSTKIGSGSIHGSNLFSGSHSNNLAMGGSHNHTPNLGIGATHGHSANLGISIGHSHGQANLGLNGNQNQSHISNLGLNGNQNHSHSSNLGLNGNHNHSHNHGLGGSQNHSSNIGLAGSHSHSCNIGLAGSHSHSSNTGLAGSHSHISNIGLAGSHSHSSNIGLAGSHSHSSNIGLAGSHSHISNIGLTGSHSHSSHIGLAGSHCHSSNIGLPGSHSHSSTIGLAGSHSHSSNIGLAGSHNHSSNIGIAGNHSHSSNIGLAGSHSHCSNIGLAGSHSHSSNIDLAGSHSHSSNIGIAGNHNHSSKHAVGSGHNHSIGLGVNGSQSHNLNIGLGSHNQSSISSVSNNHVHSTHLGLGGTYSLNNHTLSDKHSRGSKTGLGGIYTHGHNLGLSGSQNNNNSLGGHSLLSSANPGNSNKMTSSVSISKNFSNSISSTSQLNLSNTSSHSQPLQVESARYSASSSALPAQAQQYRLLKQVCRPVECYHPSGATAASYMQSPSAGASASSSAALRVQSCPAQATSAPPAQQQDMSKTSLAGHNFVSQAQSPSRPQFANFQQFRGTQHGSRPNSHPRQQQPFISGAATTTGPVMYPIVFQPHMGMQTYQQPRSGSPAGYFQYHMGHYIGYNNQPSHTPPYYAYATNSPQLPTSNVQANSAGRSNPTTLVGPQGAPATPATPAVSLPHAQPPTHLHQSMPGIRPVVPKRSHRVAIIDPVTRQDIFSDLYPSNNEYMLSGEQNDRQTPQPEPPTISIAEEFTRMVNEAVNQPSIENTAKTNFVPKNVDIPVSSMITAQPQNAISSTSSINNNIIKSDLVNINDNRSLGTDAAVTTCETPVVSAISDSPVIVPKMTLNVKPIQKSETTVQPTVIDTNKNTQKNKQNKSSVPSEKVDTNIEVVSALAGVVVSTVPAPQSTAATQAHVHSAPVAFVAPVVPVVSAPQPQRAPRERQHKSEEKDKHAKFTKDMTIASAKQNGPTSSISISSVDSFQQAINFPTSQNIINPGATSKKHAAKSLAAKELSTPAPEQPLTATELLSASIEKIAREHPFVPDPVPEKISSAFEAQAKLTQSISSVCRAQHSESKMKDINLNNKTTDPDTANGNTTEVTKPEPTKEDIHKNEKSVKNTKNSNKKAARMASNDGVVSSTESCENGKDETDNVDNVEQEIISGEDVSEDLVAEEKPAEIEDGTDVASPNAVFVPKYKYSDEQWSPLNKSGKKCYDLGLLKQIKDDPLSKNKPNAPLLEACNVIRTAPMQEQMTFTPISRPVNDTLFPTFLKGGLSGSRNTTPRDPKKDGRNMTVPGKGGSVKLGQTGGSNSSHKPVIHVSLSLREDVKLKQVDSAWKPTRLVRENLSDEELRTQELYKKFRGILNKLTPQKFDTLLKKVLELEIDNQKRMEGVIDLLFEKAIEEPNFSEAYANMCLKLSSLRVPSENNRDNGVSFRGLIISKCQTQFETGKSDELLMKLEKDLAEATEATKKKELQAMINEENRKIRLRAVANVRFIGELYKLKMLTYKIMDYCMKHLIDKLEEEKLECLCKLLTTIGEQVENEGGSQLDVIFKKMQEIVDRRSNKISSRVKFMIQDVIDLRRRKWVVKSVVDSQPKMMDQIQKEAEQQQRHIELMNAGGGNSGGGGGGGSGGFRRNDDGGRNKRGGQDSRRHPFTDSYTPRPTRPQSTNYVVDKLKLQAGSTQKNLANIKLAPPQWTSPKPQQAPATKNMYSVLENVQADPTSLKANRDSTPTYSKGASIERSTFNSRGDYNTNRSGSVGVTRSSSDSRPQSSASAAVVVAAPETPAPNAPQEPLPDDKFKKVKPIVDLTLINPDDEEFRQEILQFETKYHAAVIANILNIVVEKTVKDVNTLTKSLVYLVTTNTIAQENFEAGLKETLEIAPDLYIDIPKFYDNIGIILSPHIEKKHITLTKLFDLCGTVIAANQGHLLLKAIIHNLYESMGPTFIKIKWQESGLQFSQWMNEGQVPKWIADNKFEFLADEGTETHHANEKSIKILTPAETQSKLLQLMNADENSECIKGWVQDKLGKAHQEDWFMRVLIQAVCEYALYGSEIRDVPHFNQDRMNKYAGLIHDFGETKESREANCLFGIQHLIHRLEHPQGLTLDIFQYLHEQYLITLDGFLAWEESDKEPEGKGVMLMALTSFFTNIKEADNEDSGSED